MSIELKKTPLDDKYEGFMLALDNPDKSALIDLTFQLSPNNVNKLLSEKKSLELERAQMSKTFKGKHKVFTLEEVKEECLQYNRAFTRASRFEGEYSLELMAKIKAFITEFDLNNPGNFEYTFYCMGEMDNTADNVKIKDCAKDPLFFYRTRNDSGGRDFFILLDGDTNYVTLTNLINGFEQKHELCKIVGSLVKIILPSIAAVFLINLLFHGSCLWWGCMLIGTFFGAIATLFYMMAVNKGDSYYNMKKYQYYTNAMQR